jgi:hypothetical protein
VLACLRCVWVRVRSVWLRQSFVCQTINLCLVILLVFYKRPSGKALQSLTGIMTDGRFSKFDSEWYAVPGFYIVFTVRCAPLPRVFRSFCYWCSYSGRS